MEWMVIMKIISEGYFDAFGQKTNIIRLWKIIFFTFKFSDLYLAKMLKYFFKLSFKCIGLFGK